MHVLLIAVPKFTPTPGQFPSFCQCATSCTISRFFFFLSLHFHRCSRIGVVYKVHYRSKREYYKETSYHYSFRKWRFYCSRYHQRSYIAWCTFFLYSERMLEWDIELVYRYCDVSLIILILSTTILHWTRRRMEYQRKHV